MAGLIAGRAMAESRQPKVWGVNVCDDAETFQSDIRVILDELNAKFDLSLRKASTPIQILDGYVGAGYALPYEEEIDLIKEIARLEGLILDPVYTGKGFYGLMQEIKSGRFRKKDRILFIHTGGVYGLFPQRNIFGFAPAPVAKSAKRGKK